MSQAPARPGNYGFPSHLSLSLADCSERMERALTAEDLAQVLIVSRITIFKQGKAGRMPSFGIGI
jgi:D-Tyr-tRNAtyr deacylase